MYGLSIKNNDEKLIAVLTDGIQIITIDKANKKVFHLILDQKFGCELW